MTIFIIMDDSTREIESVWTTRAMAKAAILFHAEDTHLPPGTYRVIKREVNTAQYKKKYKGSDSSNG